MAETQTHNHQSNTGFQPVKGNVTHTRKGNVVITVLEQLKMKEVRCKCGVLICKATPPFTIEAQCTDSRCKKKTVYRVAA